MKNLKRFVIFCDNVDNNNLIKKKTINSEFLPLIEGPIPLPFIKNNRERKYIQL